MSAADLTAAQKQALADVAGKTVVYVSERNQTPQFEGTKARTDTLDILISRGLVERGERTNHSNGFTTTVNLTPLGRAVLADIKAEDKPTPKRAASPKPAAPKAAVEPTEEEVNAEGLTLNADTEPKPEEES